MLFREDIYLKDVIRRYSSNYRNESDVREYIVSLLKNFKYKGRLIPSGSQAKGTGILLSSDFDYLLSIIDDNDPLEELYNYTYDYLSFKIGIHNVRKQNVSIGISLLHKILNKQISIDITPARKHPGNTNDHSIYLSQKGTWQKTNIQKHIKDVSESGRTEEIKLLKIWRFKERLDFPSIYLEYLIIDILHRRQFEQLSNNIRFIFANLANGILEKPLYDPANSNNKLSELLDFQTRFTIKNRAWLAAQTDLRQVFNL